MKVVTLSGSPRANVGKVNATELRKTGKIPCVLYGGKEQMHFSADERDFKHIIYTPEVCFVEIDVNGKKTKAILQEAQYHRITDKLIHADFLEITEGKHVVMNIPVKLHGQSEGVKAGGKLNFKQRMLKAKAMANKMPRQVDLNIETLTVGKSIAVGDIKIDGVEFLNPKNISVVSVNMSRNVAEEAAPAAAAAAPAAAAAAKPADAAAKPAAKK
ncbi:MAG: 50S ribosomal protein L25/general stress protein Ctc [Bacteroidetes bacterium]|nr:50S ribosomal protein L25/general stress protein Ctc [Bacteroidota bacterium]